MRGIYPSWGSCASTFPEKEGDSMKNESKKIVTKAVGDKVIIGAVWKWGPLFGLKSKQK